MNKIQLLTIKWNKIKNDYSEALREYNKAKIKVDDFSMTYDELHNEIRNLTPEERKGTEFDYEN